MIVLSHSHHTKAPLEAIEALSQVCKKADTVAPALQTVHTLNCHQEMNSWLLAYDGSNLIGVLSIFQPTASEAELSGFVHPDYRRQGIFTRLIDGAKTEMVSFGQTEMLWLVNSESKAGLLYMANRAYRLKQVEHTLVYKGNLIESGSTVSISLLRTRPEDLETVARIQASAFSEKQEDALGITSRLFNDTTRENYLGYYQDQPVASVSVFVEGQKANINAVAVDRIYQGKGYGEAFMIQLINHYLVLGYTLTLEVNSENNRAYNLYKKLGFTTLEAINYYC